MQITQHNGLENSKQPVNVAQLWSKYLAYWPLFVMITGIAIAGAWLYLKYEVPLYEATATILIKDERKGTEDSKITESLNVLDTKKIIENEIEVIQSRTLLNDVINHLNLYAPIYETSGLRQVPAYKTSPVQIEVQQPDQIKEVKNISFSYDKSKATVLLDKSSYLLNNWVLTPYGTLRFTANKKYVAGNDGQLNFSLLNPKRVVQKIQEKLSAVLASKPSTILNLKLLDEVPERAEDILNELLLVYNNAVIRDKNALAANTLAFVDERLHNVAHDLDSIEQSIQRYKAQNGAIDISTQGKLFLENVSLNDQKLSELNMQIAVLNQVENYVATNSNSGAKIVPSTLGINDATLTGLLNRLYDNEMDYEKLRNTQAENDPNLMAVRNQIDKLKPAILENIQNQKRSLETSQTNIASTNNKYSSFLRGMPEKEREILNINRSQNIRNDIYNFLLQKREETSLSYASTVPDSRVVNRAEASLLPVSPKKRTAYFLAFVLAMFITVMVITIKELFNNKILFRNEIEKMTLYPVVGEIAFTKHNSAFVISKSEKTFIAEQFRKLRLAIESPTIGKNKKIAVTSTISGEGKSFIASNLALSLALANKKVVLLELDLNNPSLAKRLNSNKAEAGLTSYFEGKHEPEEIIVRTDVHENLFFIPAGKLPDNPTELLMNGRLPQLLAFLEPIFDYIVIDTAPVGPVTDACLISPYCDTTLYVVRHKYTPKVFIEKLDANNKINRLTNPLIVFNAIRTSSFDKYTYGNSIDYGYTYQKNKERIA